MIRIETFFKNHFDNKKIANVRLRAFTDDHINKLTAKLSLGANATLQQLLNDLLPLYNGYFGAIVNEATRSAVQEARTLAVDNAWNDVLNFIRQKEGTVRGIWGKESATYQEFYPLGLVEYNQATKLNKATLVARYEAAAVKYQTDLGSNFVVQYSNLKSEWESRFTEQQQQIGLVKDAASQRETNRNPLETQLMRNVLGIASLYVGNTNMVNDFFNQSLLEAPQFELPKEGTIAPGETKPVVDFKTYEPTLELLLENLLGGPLEFGLSNDGVNFVGNTTTIGAVGSTNYLMSNFGVEATKLLVRNQGTVVSQWRVDEA